MTDFEFAAEWCAAGNDAPEYYHTMARLALRVGNVNLMKNEDIWSRTIQKSVLVSAYPLAMWLASSWWRLNWEPLPAHSPSLDWRMTHEMGAANEGYVWPQIIFASDWEAVKIWTPPSADDENQSVKYLNGLAAPASIGLNGFQRGVEAFITTVISRLDVSPGCRNTPLSDLWKIIQEERAVPEIAKYRRIEAEMGFDPDECPEALMEKALSFEQEMGIDALHELTPVYGKSAKQTLIAAIRDIADSPGLIGKPAIIDSDDITPFIQTTRDAPWQHAVAKAGALRRMIGNTTNMINNAGLCDLLGLQASKVEEWAPAKRNDAAVAVPEDPKQFKFIPRKKHPIAKRFELARFIGDYLLTEPANGHWLTSTDLRTARQKYQRAFAAEFLCPIDALCAFLEGDYSESAIEEAADHFQVSQTTVTSLLLNNGIFPAASALDLDYDGGRVPYQLG